MSEDKREIHAHLEITMRDYLAGTPSNQQVLEWLEALMSRELEIWGFKVQHVHIVEVSQEGVF